MLIEAAWELGSDYKLVAAALPSSAGWRVPLFAHHQAVRG